MGGRVEVPCCAAFTEVQPGKIVSGDKVFEKNEGDYYPRWLENFVVAILDPVPMAKNFRILGPQVSENCLKREERPGGVTNELTFAVICLASKESRVDYVVSFNYFVEFKDFKEFANCTNIRDACA